MHGMLWRKRAQELSLMEMVALSSISKKKMAQEREQNLVQNAPVHMHDTRIIYFLYFS